MSIFARKYCGVICDSYAFYGINSLLSQKAREWFDYVVSLSENFKHPFTEGSCSPGNTKIVLFKNCKRAFEKNIDNINSVELGSRSEIYVDDVLHRTGEVISCSFDNRCKDSRFGILGDLLNDQLRLEIGVKLCRIIEPKYAIFYKFPFVFAPWTYVYGYRAGNRYDDVPGSRYYNEKHVDISKRISFWNIKDNNEDLACKFGFLREIYPINFISDIHLNHKVSSKMTLKNWIESENHRGNLTKSTNELYAWTIPDEDLESVTKLLAPTGILLCVNKSNPHRYDYGVRPEDNLSLN
jgi:hypothetical protein